MLHVCLQWRIAFEISTTYPEPLWFVDIVVDLAIVFDICLNLRRQVHPPWTSVSLHPIRLTCTWVCRYTFDSTTRRLVTDPKIIRRQYMTSWMPIDCVSIFPIDFLIRHLFEPGVEVSAGSSSKLARLARVARFVRLLRLTKLDNLRKAARAVNNFLQKVGMSTPGVEFMGRVAFLASVVLLITHVVACLWINLSRERSMRGLDQMVLIETSDGETVQVYDNWFGRAYQIGSVEDCKTMYPDKEEECEDAVWRVNQLSGVEPGARFQTAYIDAAYWVLTTMSTVGFGDILPYNSSERIFTCCVIVLGTFVWAYIVGSFSSALQNMDRDKNKYDEEMRSIKAMMRFHQVPDELGDRMDAFFQYKFETNTMFDDQKILDALPTQIRTDFILHRFRKIVDKIPFFRGCREDLIIEIVTRFRSFSVMPLDYFFHSGDAHVELCVLTKGRMALVHDNAGGGEIMEAEYFPGAFFGEAEFLGFGKERTATIRARTFCEVSTLHPAEMEPVLRQHVKLRRRLEKYTRLKTEIEKGLKEKGFDASLEAMMQMKEQIEAGWAVEGKEMQEAWDKMEKNKDGTVSRELIGSLSDLLGRPLKEWELDEAMRVMDADGDGFIDFEEFCDWWETNDASLSFLGRSQDEHAKSMKAMSEATLGLLHDVMERLDALSLKVDSMQRM